jgi:hypothetical protein
MQEEDEYLAKIQNSGKMVTNGSISKSPKGEQQREAYGGIP